MTNLKRTILAVEAALAQSYGFRIHTSVLDCLLNFDHAQRLMPSERGAVLVYQEPGSDELELGVYLDPSITSILQMSDPLQNLHVDNLDSFCVLIEEISHFHLVANRASMGRGVSRLELEWQGEVDKVLLAGGVLLEQTGLSHIPQLVYLILDQSVCFSSETKLYEEAAHYAARHWYQLMDDFKALTPREQWSIARNAFRGTYNLQWSEKLSSLERRRA